MADGGSSSADPVHGEDAEARRLIRLGRAVLAEASVCRMAGGRLQRLIADHGLSDAFAGVPLAGSGADAGEDCRCRAPAAPVVSKRPTVLDGRTYKVKWPLTGDNFYITINDIDDNGRRRAFEVFIACRSAEHAELLSAITLMASAILRRTDDPGFLIEDLARVHGSQGAWIGGRYVNGVVALIADVLRRHCAGEPAEAVESGRPMVSAHPAPVLGQTCPKCAAPTLFRQEGCKKCLSCGYSSCG